MQAHGLNRTTSHSSISIRFPTLLICWFIGAIILGQIGPATPLKWIIYTTPLVALMAHAVAGFRFGERLERGPAFAFLAYALAVFGTLISRTQFDYYMVRDITFIFGAIITCVQPLQPQHRDVRFLLLGLFLTLITAIIFGNVAFEDTFNILSSRGGAETSLSFAFGAIFIYFCLAKDWRWAILAGLLTLITFKRGALLAIFVVLSIHFFLQSMPGLTHFLRRTTQSLFPIAIFASATLAALYLNEIATVIVRYLDPYDSPNRFTMGRIMLSSIVGWNFQNSPWISYLFGHGPGTAELLLTQSLGQTMLPHNDYLKMLYEYGVVGAPLVCFTIYALFGTTSIGRRLLFYTAILFITDNLLIYYYYLFTCIILSRVRPPLPAARTHGNAHVDRIAQTA